MGSSKKVTVGYRYYLGLHMGLCKGPVDSLCEIRVGERIAWRGLALINTTINILAGMLFGGDEREGGIEGALDVMHGGAAQGANAYLTAKQGTPQSGYRGLLSVVFKGGQVAANNPYLKPWAFRVRRIKAGWTSAVFHPTKAVVSITIGTPVTTLAAFPTPSFWDELQSADGGGFAFGSSIYGPTIEILTRAATTVADAGGIPLGTGDEAMLLAPIQPQGPNQLQVNFRVTSITNDTTYAAVGFFTKVPTDSGLPPLVFESGGFDFYENPVTLAGCKFHFRPRAPSGVTGRPPQFTFGSGVATDSNIGSTAVTVGTWYTLKVTVDRGSGDYTLTINEAATGTLFASKSGNTAQGTGGPVHDFMDGITYVAVFGDAGGFNQGAEFAGLLLQDVELAAAMNPAHIIYECLTNTAWGMGSDASINTASFTAAADTFHAEGMGLCLHWAEQQPIQDFVQVVLDHCGAVLVQSPITSQFLLTPLRFDYTPGSLPLLDASNIIELEHYERSALPNAANEINVTYNDLYTAKQGSVKVQNLANIASIGGLVAKTTAYPGFPSPALAQRVGMRDLVAISTPLARVRLLVNRTAYQLLPGGLFRLTWPKLGITTLVMRIGTVNTGRLGDGAIRIEAVEDVFGLPAASYTAQQPGGWTEPSTAPQAATLQLIREASYFEVQRELGSADAQDLDPDAGFIVASAVRPSGDALDFGVWTRTGSAAFSEGGRGAFTPTGTLAAALSHTGTAATIVNLVDAAQVTVGGYAMIDKEVVRVDAFTPGTGVITLGRALHGTVAAQHESGARIWFVDGFTGHDVTERVDGEDVDVRITPRTGQGSVDVASPFILEQKITLDQLQSRPYAPGQLRIGGVAYPPSTTVLQFSWAHRDRLAQNFEGDESGNIGPEAGTTYNASLKAESDGTVIDSATGISGSSWAPTTLPTAAGLYRIELEAVRSGLVSAQKHRYAFVWTDPYTVLASLITSGASGGAGGTSAAPGRTLTAKASLLTGAATGD